MQSLIRGRALVAILGTAVVAAIAAPAIAVSAQPTHHGKSAAEIVAAIDTAYQAAVKRNDAATIDRILTDDFVLVTGSGKHFPKSVFVDSAKAQDCTYERQEEIDHSQTVRVYGHSTAVVTAKLWEKGICTGPGGGPFDDILWFSDTYVLRHGTWGYSFGQSSIPI